MVNSGFFIQEVVQSTIESILLFVHQTKFQGRLLRIYGNSICIFDATYKMIKYSLPLFFIVAKTNVNYQVVALFVLQDETISAVTEVFSVIKTWNRTWELKCFMVDNCDEEIKSIVNIFPRTYRNCFNIFVLIKDLFIVQNPMHFLKHAKKNQK